MNNMLKELVKENWPLLLGTILLNLVVFVGGVVVLAFAVRWVIS